MFQRYLIEKRCIRYPKSKICRRHIANKTVGIKRNSRKITIHCLSAGEKISGKSELLVKKKPLVIVNVVLNNLLGLKFCLKYDSYII